MMLLSMIFGSSGLLPPKFLINFPKFCIDMKISSLVRRQKVLAYGSAFVRSLQLHS